MAKKKTLDPTDWPAGGDDLPDLRAAFTGGGRVVLAGTVKTKSGLVVHDPFEGPEGLDPLPIEVPAGEHPLHLCIVKPKKGSERLAAAALVVSSKAPVRWERLCACDTKEWDDTGGVTAFLDPEAIFWLDEGGEQSDRVIEWSQKKPSPTDGDSRFFAARGRDFIALRSGNGRFVVYVARAKDGTPVVVAAGFGVLPRDAARKTDKTRWEVPKPPATHLPALIADRAPSEHFRRELAEDVELVLDGAPPVRGREAVLAALVKENVDAVRVGAGKENAKGVKAPLLARGEETWGEIALEVVSNTIARVRITRDRGAPVPALDGMTQDEAIRALEAAGYRFGTLETRHDPSPDGTVLAQSRAAGSVWALTTAIDIVISRGLDPAQAPKVAVPSVLGMDEGAARSALRAAGLDLEVGTPLEKRGGPAGKIREQYPAAGEGARAGMRVVVRFPPEEAKVFLPSLDGLSLADAEFRIKLVGLKKGKIEKKKDSAAEGTVLSSDPPGGSEVPPKTKVSLVVSTG